MSKIFQVVAGICMVMVVAALAGTMMKRGISGPIFFSLAAVVAGIVLIGWFQVTHRTQLAQPDVELAARVAHLEKRITDVQEVLLSIDERLQRPVPRADAKLPTV
jgi:hypothetical protein